MTLLEKNPPPRKVTPQQIITALEDATEASRAAVAESRRRGRRQWAVIAVLVALALWGAYLFHRQDSTNHTAKLSLHRQNCVVQYLEATNERQLVFLTAEWNKVNGQVEGFQQFRTASLAHQPTQALQGYDIILRATQTYRDSKAVAQRLRLYGVLIKTRADGSKYLDTRHAHTKAPCA